MNLALAIGLIWLAFVAGYCLSGMLGIGTREELERENAYLRDETIKLKSQNKTLRKDMELIQKEARFRKSINS
jgi:hypothetical protein